MKTNKLEAGPKTSQRLANALHDLRSPLMFLESIKTELPEHLHELTNIAVGRIERIIRSIVREEKRPEYASISLLIKDAISLKRQQNLTINDLHLVYELGASLNDPCQIEGLDRVLDNLIQNSIEAKKPERALRVRVDAYKNYDENQIVITITDDGKGIPRKIQKEVIKERYSFGKKHGQGLGLSSAKDFVESIGGEFSMNSRFGFGTRVELKIPCK